MKRRAAVSHQRDPDGFERKACVSGHRFHDLGNLGRAAGRDPDGDREWHESADDARARDGEARRIVSEPELADELLYLDDLADAFDDPAHTHAFGSVEARELLLEALDATMAGQRREGEGHHVARFVDDRAHARIARAEAASGAECEAPGRRAVQPTDELLGVGRARETHVEVLVEARDTEREGRAEGHVRLRMESLR